MTAESLDVQTGTVLADFEPDDYDRRILAHLQEDGRRPYMSIARDIGITEKTVRARVRHLLESGVIQIVPLCSPYAMGYTACAMVGIRCKPGTDEAQLAQNLSDIPQVDYVTQSHGRFTLLVEIIAVDSREMQQVLQKRIGQLPDIESYEVFPYFSVFYQQAATSKVGDGPALHGVSDTPMTAFDRALVEVLYEDGRMSFKTIADRLGVSETKVRQRVQDMIAQRQVHILAILNPMNLRERKIAWLAIRAASGHKLRDLATHLSQNPNVSYVAICAGRFDLFAEVICPSGEDLLTLVDEGIRNTQGVGRVEIFPYSALYYKRLRPIPAA